MSGFEQATTLLATSATSIPPSANNEARDRKTYASFGHEGVTATANAYGNLMQITRYFGKDSKDPSGFFCAELGEDVHPYPNRALERLRSFTSASVKPTSGCRLQLRDTQADEGKVPPLSFVHNRWPCFERKTRKSHFRVQYLVSKGTVYQTYTFKLNEGSIHKDPPGAFIVLVMRILDLNFMKNDDGFENLPDEAPAEDPTSDDDSLYESSSDDDSLYERLYDEGSRAKILVNENSNTRNCVIGCWQGRKPVGLDNNVSLFISAFVGGYPQRPSKVEDEDDQFNVIVDQNSWEEAVKAGELEITIAYTLKLFPLDPKPDDLRSPVSEKDHSEARNMLKKSFVPLEFNMDPHLDFILWRNVEHILSVCSIPIRNKGTWHDIPPVALTCGDVANHRVLTKASFHAFRLLLLAMKQIEERHGKKLTEVKRWDCLSGGQRGFCSHSICETYWRIWYVRWGHILWLCDNWALRGGDKRKNADETPPRWVSGRVITESKSNTLLPHDLGHENALQIIKVAEGWLSAWDKHVDEPPCERPEDGTPFGGIIKSFLGNLENTKKNARHLFSRSRKGVPEPGRFYFVDHALVWWAFRLAASLREDSDGKGPAKKGTGKESKELLRLSERIRLSTVRRFTTMNTETNKRLLATSRSLSNTHFLLGAQDTLLFYAAELGLFDKVDTQNKIAEWENTTDCQRHFEENDDSHWADPVQFALAAILTFQNKPINSVEPANMYRRAKSVLLQTSSPNGLLAGQLDSNQKPAIFKRKEMHEFYWSATFEVPYILWKYQQPPEARADTLSRSSQTHTPTVIKSSIPFISNYIDGTNIVELSDEWLYDEPGFFTSHPAIGDEDYFQREDIRGMIVDVESKDKSKDSRIAKKDKASSDNYYKQEGSGLSETKDVKNLSEGCSVTEIYRNSELRDCLSGERTPANAKKRLLQFFHANETTAEICCRASSEREELLNFFYRHANYEKHFSEYATAGLNKWATELHLTFYRLLDQRAEDDFPLADEVQFPASGKWIRRAVTSFRFDGDLFDRYWTCHFVEYDPINRPGQIEKLDVRREDQHWRQRKVLELVLFDRILERMLDATDQILREATACVAQSLNVDTTRDLGVLAASATSTLGEDVLDLLSAENNDAFLSARMICHKVQRILQAVLDDLGKNLHKIETWSDREKERKPNRPRWTRKDEQRYRSTISKWQASNKYKLLQLNRCLARIESFNLSLTRKLEDIRSDLELRGADDIRLFTYVTAVFLPIGFATGLFSMSNPPSGATLGGMFGTAILALLLTLVALVNANFLRKRVLKPAMHFCGTAFKALVRSVHELARTPEVNPRSSLTFQNQEGDSRDRNRDTLPF